MRRNRKATKPYTNMQDQERSQPDGENQNIFGDTYRLSKEQNYEQLDPRLLITKKKLLYY